MNPTTNGATTRRDFLKTTTATAAGALASQLALTANVHADGNDTIKVGIIGCGGRGSGAVSNVLHAADNVEIVACGDAFQFRVDGFRGHVENEVKKDEVKKRNNTSSLTKDNCFAGLNAYQDVINSGANYIILATPPGFRPLHLQAAVAAGKNIFTEKPVAVDGPGYRKVIEAYQTALKKKLGIAAGKIGRAHV